MGEARVMDDMGQDGMLCTNHPYSNTGSGGGICGFCLQEKLGKLVSSSTLAFDTFSAGAGIVAAGKYGIPAGGAAGSQRLASDVVNRSSSSSPSFTIEATRPIPPPPQIYMGSAAKKKKSVPVDQGRILPLLSSAEKQGAGTTTVQTPVMVRSKSVATRRLVGDGVEGNNGSSPRKRSFWSFLHFAKRRGGHGRRRWDVGFPEEEDQDEPTMAAAVKVSTPAAVPAAPPAPASSWVGVSGRDNESPTSQASSSSFGRKVARSRSVGCGSRSFSGDFLEKISHGFADCTLRRVESQREAKPKIVLHGANGTPGVGGGSEGIKEHVRCGGIFGGFGISPFNYSSSSAASSSYWISEDFKEVDNGGRPSSATASGAPPHWRGKSWGWALTSPMRVFRPPKPSSVISEMEGDHAGSHRRTAHVGIVNGGISRSIMVVGGGG